MMGSSAPMDAQGARRSTISRRRGHAAPGHVLRAAQPHHQETPLVDALLERASRPDAPFHIPGHKKGTAVHASFQRLLDAGVLRHDLTEVPGLDYLMSPTGVIQRAQQLAAHTFHAQRTWLLVNGSSVGIHASIMAVAGPGDTLLVARNCHKAAFAGLVLSGCEPWWLQPEQDPELGIAHTVTPAALEDQLAAARAAGKRAAGVLVVSPTYFGMRADVAGLARVCHAAGVPLVVDEAHGAHFGLHPALPPSAVQEGADVAIHSTHKVLAAMTQASMLHLGGGSLVSAERVSRALELLQSSSPSYVLMASLDAARAQAADAEACFAEPLRAAQVVRQGLASISGISLVQYDDDGDGHGAAHASDPLRFTVCVKGLGLTGYDAADILDEQHGVVSELSNHQVVVFVLGPGSTQHHAEQLVQAFRALSARRGPEQQRGGLAQSQAPRRRRVQPPHQQPQRHLTPRDAFFARTERLPADQAVGRVSCELLCPYPPGVPVVYPGEVLTSDALQALRAVLQAGGKVVGASDAALDTLLVAAAASPAAA